MNIKKRIILLAIAVGAMFGLGGFTFYYGEGLSYMSTDPKACINCHIMQSQYDSWLKASHQNAATCVQCHLPQDFPNKYISKAENGYNHSRAFTFQDFHEPIMITPKNSIILQNNCINCHGDMTHSLVQSHVDDPNAVQCVKCHQTVGHGEPVGLGGPIQEHEKGGIYQ